MLGVVKEVTNTQPFALANDPYNNTNHVRN